jgi:hypothetical protein
MTTDIIDTVNKDVLKSFKHMKKEKTYLYTSATNEYLSCINDKSMIVYDNPDEIDFEGTFRLTRNKLMPVVDHDLGTSPESAIDLNHFKYLNDFNKNIAELQRFCYDNNIRLNTADITQTLTQLISVYKSYRLYKNTKHEEVMFVFSNSEHKTYLLSKLI